MSTRRDGIDSLPLSGLVPSKASVAHVASVGFAVTAGFTAIALFNGLGERLRWPPESDPSTLAMFTAEFADMFGSATMYPMMTAALALIFVLEFSPGKRFLTAVVVAMPITGFFGAMGQLSSAIEIAYRPHPRHPDPSIAYYAGETWSGFVDGATGALLFSFIVALPFFVLVVVSDRYAGTTLLRGACGR